jgi:hypothetical protein
LTPRDTNRSEVSTEKTGLARRLGTADAVVIGLSAMIGAGVFAAFAPAAAAAGTGLLIDLLVAYCNAISSAVLAAKYPQSVRPLVEPLERAADNLLRMAKAVGGGVDPVDTELENSVDGPDRLLVGHYRQPPYPIPANPRSKLTFPVRELPSGSRFCHLRVSCSRVSARAGRREADDEFGTCPALDRRRWSGSYKHGARSG